MTLSEYVRGQIDMRIGKLTDQALATEHDTSEDGVHDLRTNIRRLNEALKVFKDLFPRGAAKTVRDDLRLAMRAAGDARNVDIARKLLAKAELPADPKLDKRRERAAARLSGILAGWNRGTAPRTWKENLNG